MMAPPVFLSTFFCWRALPQAHSASEHIDHLMILFSIDHWHRIRQLSKIKNQIGKNALGAGRL
jgi:hypothetical protein